jgi:hypothetical protein
VCASMLSQGRGVCHVSDDFGACMRMILAGGCDGGFGALPISFASFGQKPQHDIVVAAFQPERVFASLSDADTQC